MLGEHTGTGDKQHTHTGLCRILHAHREMTDALWRGLVTHRLLQAPDAEAEVEATPCLLRWL